MLKNLVKIKTERVDQERDHYQQRSFQNGVSIFKSMKIFSARLEAKELELDLEWRSVFKSLFLKKIERIFGEILLSILRIS